MLNPFTSLHSPFSPYDDDDDDDEGGNIVFLANPTVSVGDGSSGGGSGSGSDTVIELDQSSATREGADIISVTPAQGMGWISFVPASICVPDFNEVEPGLLIGDYFTVPSSTSTTRSSHHPDFPLLSVPVFYCPSLFDSFFGCFIVSCVCTNTHKDVGRPSTTIRWSGEAGHGHSHPQCHPTE